MYNTYAGGCNILNLQISHHKSLDVKSNNNKSWDYTNPLLPMGGNIGGGSSVGSNIGLDSQLQLQQQQRLDMNYSNMNMNMGMNMNMNMNNPNEINLMGGGLGGGGNSQGMNKNLNSLNNK